MKIISIAIISTLTSLAIIGSVHAHNQEKFMNRMTQKLSLNDSQQNQLRVFIDEKQVLKAERRAKYKARKENGYKANPNGPFAKLWEQDTISVNDINSAIDEIHQKKRERRQNILKSFVSFYNSLSNEQREKAKPMFRKMLRQSMGKHGGHKKGHNKGYSSNSDQHRFKTPQQG